jgi:hypothetical protein
MLRLHTEAVAARLIGDPSYFSGMVETHGGREAVKRLLRGSKPQYGLLALRESDRDGSRRYYQYSCEYVILNEREWRPLFTQRLLQKAYKWLHDLWPDVAFPEV